MTTNDPPGHLPNCIPTYGRHLPVKRRAGPPPVADAKLLVFRFSRLQNLLLKRRVGNCGTTTGACARGAQLVTVDYGTRCLMGVSKRVWLSWLQ